MPQRSRRRPTAPPAKGWAPTLKFPRVTESKIQKTIVRQLQLCGVPDLVWFHPANGGARTKAEAGRFRAEGVVAGIPDLVLLHKGRSYFLELKAAKGRLSPAQRDVHTRIVAAGGNVCTAYGLDAALAQLEDWGLIR
jgi:streptogramin lyase